MSDPGVGSKAPRPRPVTIAGVMAASTCALLVLVLFEAQSQLFSIDERRAITRTLTDLGVVGFTTADFIALLRAIVLVSAALSAAGLVLAVYALQGNRGARIGLSIVAVGLLFTATLVTGPLPLLVVFAAARLWIRDAREWYDGGARNAGSR